MIKSLAAPSFFVCLCCAGALVAFTGGCAPSRSDPRDPSHLVVGIESHPIHLDPRFATDANSSRVAALIYNSLLRADHNAELEPELAVSWRTVDPQTYIFELRRGVTFHDGAPLTARDVKYTYDSILDARKRSPKRALLNSLVGVDELAPHRIRFRLSGPYAPFLEQCAIGIVPAHAPAAAIPPLGSGPFILESIQPGEKVRLRANPNYWDGRPPISGLTFAAVPDAMVRVLEYKKGTIDFLQNDIEPDMLPWLRRSTDAVIEMNQGTTFQYIGINLTHPVLKQVKVRQALAHAVDRDRIIRHLLKDQATAAAGLLSPLHWAYEGAVAQWPHDPERAKVLLDQAGFPDPDGDGPRPRLRLSFKTTNIELRKRIAEALKEQLQQVGVELEIRTFEWGTFYSDVKKGNFHLFSLAWVGINDPDIYYNIFHSSSRPPNGDNRGGYANPELDRLLEQGRRTLDMEKRKLIYSQVQRIVASELPYIPLWWWKNVIVRRPEIQGVLPYPNGDWTFFKDVSVQPARRTP